MSLVRGWKPQWMITCLQTCQLFTPFGWQIVTSLLLLCKLPCSTLRTWILKYNKRHKRTGQILLIGNMVEISSIVAGLSEKVYSLASLAAKQWLNVFVVFFSDIFFRKRLSGYSDPKQHSNALAAQMLTMYVNTSHYVRVIISWRQPTFWQSTKWQRWMF